MLDLPLKLRLTDQRCVVVIGAVGANFRPYKLGLDELLCNLLKRLPVLLIHPRKKNGSMMTIMQMTAMLVVPSVLSKKKDGTPISAPAPKQIS